MMVLGGLLLWAQMPAPQPASASHQSESFSHQSDSPLESPPLRIDRDRLKRQRADQYGEARKTVKGTDTLARLHRVVEQANEHQFQSEPDEEPSADVQEERRTLRSTIKQASQDVITLTGYDGYVAAGEPLFETCSEGLEALLEAVQTGDVSMERARAQPPADTFETYRRHCGQLLPRLVELGLVTPEGTWHEPASRSRTIVGLLQRYRWAFNIREHRRPLLQLTAYGRELLFRYRIRNGEGFSPDQRKRFVQQIATDSGLLPDIDVPLLRARLAYDLEEYERARSVLKQAIEKDEGDVETYRRLLAWLKQHGP